MPLQVALLVLAAIWRWQGSSPYEEPRGPGSRQHQYWLSVSNKRSYADRHGYPLYVLSHHLEAGRWPTWDKLLAARAVLQHSHAEWLWMMDADAFIMNPNIEITNVIARAVQQSIASRGHAPDMIVAQDCLLPVNSGSVILRNTPWTHQHLSDLWHADDNCNGYTDNGAFLELWKQQEVRQHYWQLPQRQLNAYPDMAGVNGPACPNGTYQDGDLLLHFPGDFKALLPAFLQNHSLHGLPLPAAARSSATTTLSSSSKAQNDQPLGSKHAAPCYAVYDSHLRGGTDAADTAAEQQRADLVSLQMVTMRQQGITTVTKVAAITLSIQQQQQQLLPGSHSQRLQPNPGWPVAAPVGVAVGKREGHTPQQSPVSEIDYQ